MRTTKEGVESRYHVHVRMMIDGEPAKPFSAEVLEMQSVWERCSTNRTGSDRIPANFCDGGHVARPSTRLSTERFRELARTGAETLLKQLRAEIVAIERTFPELALPRRRRAVRRTIKTARMRGREVSQAARREISRRMKRDWAERKKAKAKVK